MPPQTHAIPGRLNLALAALQTVALLALLWTAGRVHGVWLFVVAIGYGIVMNSAYAMLHEAEHGILHPQRRLNDGVGVWLALFFPAPFHLIRQGHLGHHLRNRSDDEAFDFYFEGENRVWKQMQLYGILTGFFWLVITFSNLFTCVWPWFLKPRAFSFDRPTAALLQSLNKRFLPAVWLESVAAVVLHGAFITLWHIPILHWFAVMAGFGVIWSAMQYVHHFGTERDVLNGARNLRTWRWLDLVWLNHNWHLRHHQKPTVPWVHLPKLEEGPHTPRAHVLPAYFRMWRGSKLTHEHVENRYAGRIIR